MRLLAPGERIQGLRCPACGCERLRDEVDAVICERCARRFDCRRDVIDFVLVDRLDATGRREQTANAVDLESTRAVARRIGKGEDDPVLKAQMGRSIRAIERMLDTGAHGGTLVSLGSGSGFELRLLLARRVFERVYSSDLAWSTTALAPRVLHDFEGELGLFAADFAHLPLGRAADRVGLVFLALHHTEDPHGILAAMLEHNFEQLLLVEPITNWLVEILARIGLARRLEYSGTQPHWLRVAHLRRIARDQGCHMRIETWWELPRDALPARLRRSRSAWRAPLALVALWSRLTRTLNFGSMAAVRFDRRASAEEGPPPNPTAARTGSATRPSPPSAPPAPRSRAG